MAGGADAVRHGHALYLPDALERKYPNAAAGWCHPLTRSERPLLALSLRFRHNDRHPHPQQAGSHPGLG